MGLGEGVGRTCQYKRSNLSVSRICLGTMHFGSSAPRAEAFRIMDRSIDSSVG